MSNSNKLIIILNGKGGVGKDYLADLLQSKGGYKVKVVSSVDKVKEAASILGWDGTKTAENRQFLSKLKSLSVEYLNHPVKYMCTNCFDFIYDTGLDILVLMIREIEEIREMKKLISEKFSDNIKSVLITRPDLDDVVFGNSSDDYIYEYKDEYDLVFENNLNDEANNAYFIECIEKFMK